MAAGAQSARFAGQDRRTLSPAERDTLLRWARTGARVDGTKVGRHRSRPRVHAPERPCCACGLPAPYTPRSANGGTDDYRCFMLDPKLSADAFATSIRIEPDAARLVHHVILFRAAAESVAEANALDRASPGPGWSCFGGTGIGARVERRARLAAWAMHRGSPPGRRAGAATGSPTGLGVSLPAGSRVVMQVHYNLLNGRRADRSRAVLTTVPASEGLTPLETTLLPAPVELPCAKGETGPLCDRTTAMFDLIRKYGQDAGLIPVGLLLFCGKDAANPPAGPVTSCVQRFDGPTTIRSVAGHMHVLGRSIRVELNPGTSRARVLLDIPRWSFHWQASYVLAQPVQAQAGDVLRVTCRHDASLRKQQPQTAARKPRYILWGEGTTDEMCLGIVQVTRGPEPQRRRRAHPPRLADVSGPVGAGPRPLRGGARARARCPRP